MPTAGASGDVAIKVTDLAKRYAIGQHKTGYGTLRESLTRAVLRLGRSSAASQKSDFWALRDISFHIPRGEITGIVGRNGAGKSTLLKILARITEPTCGSAEIHGRIGSLLEVGTGFHPELSGRENIYLNGAMLGMTKREIRSKFEEIVDFSEQADFIDTPVKHYSSGMYMRLAFSVAAHLDPDILLVDEVLAVGDAAFQKKCLGKMGTIAGQGRTILFVSHDVTSVAVLCQSAILLAGGSLVCKGPTSAVLNQYLGGAADACSTLEWYRDDAPGDGSVRIRSLRLQLRDGRPAGLFSTSDAIVVALEYEVLKSNLRVNPVLLVRNSQGILLFSTANYSDPQWGAREHEAGLFHTECTIPADLLNDDSYSVDALMVVNMRDVRAEVRDRLRFSVIDDGTDRGDYTGVWNGAVRPRCDWATEPSLARIVTTRTLS